ncbi:hypothetical protein [Paractinoplanes rishiriensis]|uniref:Uncharacterized protein n=1 Tax=Paractinoplanes rishiriensis TaxID=1050105 RepID=A0A919N249_9ACTN|nr:hypothetical protein [Actinoplanes rishiriensis]GIE98617.1 hypothetical protein Ari01nite_60820 [Actinoplanes rishiriensis]
MTDRPVEIVRGELQPWTDYGAHSPAGGAALLALLGDLLPERSARTLVAGPHDRAVLDLAAARSAALTVLVRSVSDAAALREWLPEPHVTVVAGALDGLTGVPPFDVVLAADGLDRVLGADSPALDWPGRLAELDRLAAPDALVVVAVENEFALTGLLDRRPADARHGDEEWRPLHDDPDRPTSPAQVTAALGGEVRLYAAFAGHSLLGADVLAESRPGRLGTRLAIAGLDATAAQVPLLAPLDDGAGAAARAGLLAAVAPGWLAVRGSGGGATHAGYAAAGDGVLAVDLDEDDGWTVSVRSGATAAFDPALVPHRLPDTASVETQLFRLAAAEDVPGFRALAARVGAWANPEGVICLDDLHPDGDGFSRGVLGHPAAAGEGTAELLAGAWHRFRDRLLRAHRRHPWPPWMSGSDDLVSAWLGMSGVEASAAVLKAGREIADRVAEPPVAEPDVRAALAGAAAAEVRITELAGQVFGLERTIRFRDQSLRTREQQLRTMRDELRGLRGSPAGRLHALARKVAKIRHPRQFARAVKRRLRGA